jgi:hypothetical protein
MIEYIDIRGWNRDKWVAWRERGFGGSETGGVTNWSRFDDALKIHLNKIGEPVTTFTGNKETYFGQLAEPEIADLYQYWEHIENNPVLNMFKNKENKKKINHVRSVYAYVVNSKYPWLFASIDRRILRNRKTKKGRGILECKNTTSMEKNTYEHKINPGHVLQVYQYLMILEWEFADVAIKFDGNNFDVVEFLPNQEMFDFIQYHTAKAWQNVEKARQIKKDYDVPMYYGMPDYYFTTSKQMDGIALLQELEPDITPISIKYLEDMIKPTPTYTEMVGTQEIYEVAVAYHAALKERSVAQGEIDKHKGKLLSLLKGAHVAKFDNGHVSYKPDVDGINRLYVSPKLMII